MRAKLLLPSTLALFAGLLVLGQGRAAPDDDEVPMASYDDAFWKRWGDGKAEIAGYELTFPRYGETRNGTAVTIFVTENFTSAARVKTDGGHSDEYPVLKLNLVRDFPTGVYDYNLMTSAFVALKAANGAPGGYPTKVSFTSQEWCGHVYHHVLFDKDATREQLHSYFDGEADKSGTLERPEGGVSEDTLFMWARGLAAPALKPGESKTVPLLGSLLRARLEHRAVAWTEVTLSRDAKAQTVKVPAGAFDVDVLHAQVKGGLRWSFYVEQAQPRRLVRWETSAGERGDMIAAKRMAYWKMQGNGGERFLKELGLKARPPRTP